MDDVIKKVKETVVTIATPQLEELGIYLQELKDTGIIQDYRIDLNVTIMPIKAVDKIELTVKINED